MDDDRENHNFLPDIPLEDIEQDSLTEESLRKNWQLK